MFKAAFTFFLIGLSLTSASAFFPVVNCITHTGSKLEIESSDVRLTTTDGQTTDYMIINKHVVTLESYPSIEETTYKMNDGRAIVTRFMGLSNSGTGFFVRTDRSTSPTFRCTKTN